MNNPENTRGTLLPVAIATVVAVIGTAALFVLDLRTRDEAAGNGVSMITTAAAERAGATVHPTAPDIGANQIRYVP